jgi:hypothetical protein
MIADLPGMGYGKRALLVEYVRNPPGGGALHQLVLSMVARKASTVIRIRADWGSRRWGMVVRLPCEIF